MRSRLTALLMLLGTSGLLLGVPTGGLHGSAAIPLGPNWIATPSNAHLGASSALKSPAVAAVSPAVGPSLLAPRDLAVSPGVTPAASTPSSDVVETPSPVIPPTSPTTFVMASSITTYLVNYNVTAPAGPWALILFNYTGSVPSTSQVYDSSYHASVGGVPVFFGTTPELYQWTVLKDLTEYSALFEHGTVEFSFNLGAAVIKGSFVTSLSISFYPVPDGATPPTVPTEIVPLFPFTTVSSTRPVLHTNATVPSDAANATLEVYSYGFSGGSTEDEFWYAADPAYRAVSFSVDGTPLATVQPFEYVNTGGLDLFLWDPVTGAYTANDVPYEVDVTAALGLLEGTHETNASVVGVATGSHWFIAAALMVYTNSSYRGATENSAPPPSQTYSNGTSGQNSTESVRRSYEYQTTFTLSKGSEVSEAWTNETFDGRFDVQTSSTTTTSDSAVSASTTTVDRLSGSSGNLWVNSSSRPSMQYDSSETFKESSSNGGGYPIYGNVTYVAQVLRQGWNLSWATSALGANGRWTAIGSSSRDNVTANGSYVAEEELISAAAAMILSFTTFWSNTSKTFHSVEFDALASANYTHLLVSHLTPANLTTNRADVAVNSVSLTNAVVLSASRNETDAGLPITLSARVLGQGGPFVLTWSGLPAGCPVPTSPTTTSIRCAPSTPGTAHVTATVTPAVGPSLSSTVSLLVLADPVATVGATRTMIDVTQSVNLTASISNGLGPFECQWFAGGVPLTGEIACTTGLAAYTPPSEGIYNLTVNVTDALGFSGLGGSLTLTVEGTPDAVLVLAESGGTTSVAVGGTIELEVSVSGGVHPFTYTWSIDGRTDPTAGNVPTFNWTPTKAGSSAVVVNVRDATGVSVESESVTLTATSSGPGGGSGGNGGGSGGGTSGLNGPVGISIVAAIAVLVVAVALLVLWTRRRPPVTR